LSWQKAHNLTEGGKKAKTGGDALVGRKKDKGPDLKSHGRSLGKGGGGNRIRGGNPRGILCPGNMDEGEKKVTDELRKLKQKGKGDGTHCEKKDCLKEGCARKEEEKKLKKRAIY